MTRVTPHPLIVSREEWIIERKKLLQREKEETKQYDRVNAERRRLPMVKIAKDYVFDGPNGRQNLKTLFGDRRQLIVYHFMFDPTWGKGCSGCTTWVDALGDLSPLDNLEAYKAQKRWDILWLSSLDTAFNYDFHVTLDLKVAPVEYNYRTEAETAATKGQPAHLEGEHHGLSVFFKLDEDVFHTYSVFARGCESLPNAYRLLDTTPYGRQQDFEDSPHGWPQKPTYGKAD